MSDGASQSFGQAYCAGDGTRKARGLLVRQKPTAYLIQLECWSFVY